MRLEKSDYLYVLALVALLWIVNAVWLLLDTRPPVWDMAMHQSYALNYWPGHPPRAPLLDRSGNYPPFVHLVIACGFLLFHPSPRIAALANLPASLILLSAVYQLALDLAGRAAARWACLITALIPYLMWCSRETVLDYWVSAWVAASLVLLRNTEGFGVRRPSLLLGAALALGLLTKWLFAAWVVFPLAYISIRYKIWRETARLLNFLDALLIGGLLSGVWYIPKLPGLLRYFGENALIGAREGEPPVLSLQSWIYYLRLLEGYQLFALLFVFVLVSGAVACRKKLLLDGRYLAVAVAGGWLAMTLLRTKDGRFTMPLLGLLSIVPGAWVQTWGRTWQALLGRVAFASVLLLQAYAVNFGISWLPASVVLAEGYQGSLRWDWNLYLQNYFGILGPPRREDWKQVEILSVMAEHARRHGLRPSLAVIPDLPRFNAANFQLYSRLLRIPASVDHLQSAEQGIRSFEGFDYVIMTERDQGMPWSTVNSRALNQIVVDEPQVFRLVGLYELPDRDAARLYAIQRKAKVN